MNKLLVICGPTATGKTNLGVYLAKKFKGEIISADSRQVYRGIDIITGKDIDKDSELKVKNFELGIENKEMTVGYRLKEGIPIWLVDIVTPDYPFNVAQYAYLAHKVMKNLWLRQKLPIAVGGAGLYIRSLIEFIDTIILPPNKLLRKELERASLAVLQEKLAMLDPQKLETMNNSDRQNPRRLIRAIEVAGYREKLSHKISNFSFSFPDSFLMIGLKAPLKIFLYQKIDKRVEERVKMGALVEVEKLREKKYSWFLPALTSTGAVELKNFLEKKMTLPEAIVAWKFKEHKYARRQLTWFKRISQIEWFEVTKKEYLEEIEEKVRRWYTS